MGARNSPIYVMAWQSTLAAMKAHGTLVLLTGCRCGHSEDVDLDQMIREMGEAAHLWGLLPVCPACLEEQHYMAAPGPNTPYRPLLTDGRPIVGLPA